MPRWPKKDADVEIALKEPEVSHNPEDYVDYTSALIRYGMLIHEKRKNNGKILKSGLDEVYGVNGEPVEITSQQVVYLNMRMSGLSTKDACKALEIDTMQPMLWEEECDKNSVYVCCVEALRKLEASMLEDKLWAKAINDSRADAVALACLKARMPEYKENAPVVGVNMVQVNITVENQPYVVDTGVTPLERVDDEDDLEG